MRDAVPVRPSTVLRIASLALGLAALVGVTAGCGAPSSDPPRDALGRVTETARTSAFALEVGDCTGPIDPANNIETVDVIPCDRSHAFEVYAAHTMAEPTFPGMEEAGTVAERECRTAFADFVGVPNDQSTYTMLYLYPTQRSWRGQTDRQVLCLVGRESGGVTGSLKGAKE
ncbi:hypothetical protein BKD30_03610 [Tersicoccus phoenicis]|uniref:Septum formation-related domain-containing protein n=1 Tax=Tersicoccus phoenicis TaxID=554083 RepID=A0A1R1LJM1_9MICC|nr:septum formation family protein [Tersicoccus phoenicis]OMH27731.1 hypothetical protein BKD30_03610 [Tersicoccus phoenicis]